MRMYAIWLPSLPTFTEIDNTSICLKAQLHKVNMSIISTRMVTHCNRGISTDFGLVAQSFKYGEPVRRLSGMHGETCYVLPRDEISKTLSDADLHSKAPPIEMQSQLSQLKQIHALCAVSEKGDYAFVSTGFAALEDVYTDAHLFETICQICGDEQHGAGTHELVHHIRGDAVADEESLDSLTHRKPMEFPSWGLPHSS
jgi:hypothetical protein